MAICFPPVKFLIEEFRPAHPPLQVLVWIWGVKFGFALLCCTFSCKLNQSRGWYSSTAQASASCRKTWYSSRILFSFTKRKGTWLWASLPYQKSEWTDFRFRAGFQRAIAWHMSATAQQQQLCNSYRVPFLYFNLLHTLQQQSTLQSSDFLEEHKKALALSCSAFVPVPGSIIT